MHLQVTHRLAVPALATLLALSLAACGGDEAARTTPTAPALATIQVASGGDASRAWDGTIEAVRAATLAAQTGGRVQSVAVDVNDRVAAGQVLLRLTVVEQQAGVDAARAQLRAAEASATEAERQYQRFAALAKDRFVSNAQVDQARAARDAAVAARDAARAQLASAGQAADYTVVRAPYAGVVTAREVEPGETVSPGQVLMALLAPEALRIEVMVPQSAAEAIRANPRATVHLDDGRTLDAGEVTVYPAADARSHSVAVRVTLPTMDAPPTPGASAKVRFAAAGRDGSAVTVPATAVVTRGELTAVYVVDGGRVLLRQVRLGERTGETVEVLAGLRGGERVARDPAAALAALRAQRATAGGSE